MTLEELATKTDIERLVNAIEELKSSLKRNDNIFEQKFLRSSDVKKILNISHSTLQRMRISGVVSAKKLNGTWFYSLIDLKKRLTV